MKRRHFLLGAGTAAAAGAAVFGTGAFSRIESQRQVTIQVATDENAYLRLAPIEGSENSQNYASIDSHGHLEIEIADSGSGGEGVNSNSLTFFDDLFEVCNQGKEDAAVYIDADDLDTGDAEVLFYTGTASGSRGDEGIGSITDAEWVADFAPAEIELGGECVNVGLLVDTGAGSAYTDAETVDATEVSDSGEPLVSGKITIIADVGVDPGTATSLLSDLDIDGQGDVASVDSGAEFDVSVLVTNTGQRAGSFEVSFVAILDDHRESVRDALSETGTGIADLEVEDPPNTQIGFGQVDVSGAYGQLAGD